MDDLSVKISAWVFPGLLGLSIFLVQRFVAKVDKELETLKDNVDKTSSVVNDKTAEIRITLTTLEMALKNTGEKAEALARSLSELYAKVDKHQELHIKAAQIFHAHRESINRNKAEIETVIRDLGDIRIVGERKKNS